MRWKWTSAGDIVAEDYSVASRNGTANKQALQQCLLAQQHRTDRTSIRKQEDLGYEGCKEGRMDVAGIKMVRLSNPQMRLASEQGDLNFRTIALWSPSDSFESH